MSDQTVLSWSISHPPFFFFFDSSFCVVIDARVSLSEVFLAVLDSIAISYSHVYNVDHLTLYLNLLSHIHRLGGSGHIHVRL